MIHLIHIGLLISCVGNLLAIWSIHICLKRHDQEIDALEKLVIEIATKQIQGVYSNVVSIGLKKN